MNLRDPRRCTYSGGLGVGGSNPLAPTNFSVGEEGESPPLALGLGSDLVVDRWDPLPSFLPLLFAEDLDDRFLVTRGHGLGPGVVALLHFRSCLAQRGGHSDRSY